MAIDGGEGNDGGWFVLQRKKIMHERGKRIGKGSNGMILVIVDNIAEKAGTFAYDVGWREIGAVWTFSGLGRSFTIWTNGLVIVFDVIFTTIA